MKRKQGWFSGQALIAAMTALGLALAGCDNNDGTTAGASTGTTTATISGIAALGDPIVGGTVSLVCSGAGTVPAIAPTSATGSWTVTLPADMLPCAAGVTGGTLGAAVLHSFIPALPPGTATAVANITTFTDLALALAVRAAASQDIAAWYAAASTANYAAIATGLAAAQTQLVNALTAAGYVVPGGFNPFTAVFTAAAGNNYDDLMEALRAAIAAASSDYATLLATFASGAGTPALPMNDTGDGDPDEPDEPDEPEEPAGENPLGDKNGIAFTIDGHTWKFHGATTPRGFGVPDNTRRAQAKNAINDAHTDYVDPAEIKAGFGKVTKAEVTVQRTASPGLQNCGGDINIKLESLIPGVFTQEGREWNATACQIDLDYISDRGGLGGTIVSATLSNTHTLGNDPTPIVTTVTISGGQFRVYHHRGTVGSAPATVPDDAYNVMSITDGNFEFTEGDYFIMKNNIGHGGTSPDDGTEPFGSGNASDDIVWTFGADFFGAAGANNTNVCGTRYTGLPNNKFNMTVSVGPYQGTMDFNAGSIAGEGSCSVTLDQSAGGLYRGHYTATLVTRDNNTNNSPDYLNSLAARTISVTGLFKNFLLVPIRADNDGDEGALGEASRKATVVIEEGNAHFTADDSFLLTNTSQELQAGTSPYRMDFRRVFDSFNTTNIERGQRGVTIQFLQVPRSPDQTGDFTCVSSGSGTTISLITDQGFSYGSNTAGGSCTIHVTSYTATKVEGTYTATLVAANVADFLPNGDNTVTIHGSFRENIAQVAP